MSVHFFKKAKQCEKPEGFGDMILDIMRHGEIPRQKLSEKEKANFSKGTIKEIWLYPESQQGRPAEEIKKLNIYFSRSRLPKGRFRYGMHLQTNIIPLQKDDIIDTSDAINKKGGALIEKTHDVNNAETDFIQIPMTAIEKLNPRIITREERTIKEVQPHTYDVKTDKYDYAMIAIKDSSFNNLVKYAKSGEFTTKFLALLRYYSPGEDQGKKQKLETFFKEEGAYNEKKYKDFIKQNAGEMIRIIENKNNAADNVGKTLREKFDVSTPARKMISLKNFEIILGSMPEKNLKDMKEEILKMSEQ